MWLFSSHCGFQEKGFKRDCQSAKTKAEDGEASKTGKTSEGEEAA